MPKYLLEFVNQVTYQVEIEAESHDEAYKVTQDWGKDDFNDEEIVSNVWDVEITESD